MNHLTTLKVLFNNALSNNQKFICIPHRRHYYTILVLLKLKGYIKNFICINFYNKFKSYILIEFPYFKNYIKKFKIIVFKSKLKVSAMIFKDILKLYKFSGLFIFSTSLGLLTLEQLNFFKIGGVLILYVY